MLVSTDETIGESDICEETQQNENDDEGVGGVCNLAPSRAIFRDPISGALEHCPFRTNASNMGMPIS